MRNTAIKMFWHLNVVMGILIWCVGLDRPSLVEAATYFVDFAAGSDARDGLTPLTSWRTIPWDSRATGVSAQTDLGPGDKIVFKPGTIYSVPRPIIPTESGSSGQPIVLSGSPADWGSGTENAIFTGAPLNGPYEGIFKLFAADQAAYISFTHLTFRDMTIGTTFDFEGVAQDIILDDILVDNCDGMYGAFFFNVDNLLVKNSTFRNCQSSGLRIENGQNVIVEDSVFHTNGPGSNQDGLFIGSNGAGKDVTFIVRRCVAFNNGIGSQGSGFDSSTFSGGTISSGLYERCLSYGNGNYGFSGSDATCIWRNNIAFHNQTNFGFYERGNASYFNNVSDAPQYWAFSLSPETGQIIGVLKNNIIRKVESYNGSSGNGGIQIGSGVTYTGDNNLFFLSGGYVGRWGGTDLNFSTWKLNTGQDGASINTNPLFESNSARPDPAYFKLTSNSPAVNSGSTLAGFSDDYAGGVRPQGGVWDIGAFEFVSGAPPVTLPVAPRLAAFPLSPTRIQLSWSLPAEDTGLVSAKLFRDGSEMATLPASTPSYIDNGLVPDSMHVYTVVVYDAAGNASPASAPVWMPTFHSYSLPGPLKMHLNFNVGSGLVIPDISGNTYHGEFFDDATWTNSGLHSAGVTLDGHRDTVQGMGSTPFEYTGGNMTLSLWYYADGADTDGGPILSKSWMRNGDLDYQIYRNVNNQVWFRLMRDEYMAFVTSNVLQLNDWNHIAVTLSSDRKIKIFLNGVLDIDSIYETSNWVPSTNEQGSLTLGCWYENPGDFNGVNALCVQGKIDNVRFYDAALSPEDVGRLYSLENIPDGQGAVFISSPAFEGDVVSGTPVLNAEAVGVIQSVQFTLDDAPIGGPDTSAPYELSTWDSSTVLNGSHRLGAIAVTGTGVVISSLPRRILVSNGSGVVVQAVPAISEDKILPDMTALPGIPSDTLSMSAARGEFEPVSFVLRSQYSDLTNVTLVASDLEGPGRIPSDQVDIKIVKTWYQSGMGAWTNIEQLGGKVPTLVPELLLNNDGMIIVDTVNQTNTVRLTNGRLVNISDPVNTTETEISAADFPIADAATLQPIARLPAGEAKQIWITVHVPNDALSGTYSGAITLSANGSVIKTLSLSVRVHGFDLFETPTEQSIYTYGYLSSWRTSPSNILIGGQAKSEAQYRAEMINMRDHGVKNPVLQQPVPGSPPTQGTSDIEKELSIRRELGMNGGPIYSIGVGPNLDTLPTFQKLDHDVPILHELAARYGFTDVYVYAIDEANATGGEPLMISEFPHFQHVHDLGAKNFVAGYAPQYTAFTTPTTFNGRTQSTYQWLLELLDTTVDGGRKRADYAADWHENGHEILSYGDPQNGVENPQLYRRNYGVVIWAADYDGAMDFGYQIAMGKIWNDFDSADYRDHVCVYPTMEKPIDTIAWEGYREGIDDLRYIATLESAIAAGSASSDPAKRTSSIQAQNYLDNLKSTVLGQIGAGIGTANFSIDLYAMRETIVNYILAINIFLPPSSTYRLSVSKTGTGTGTVSATNGSIDCGDTCSAVFDTGTSVTLTATPDPGSNFSGWAGGGCSGTEPCTVTLRSNRTVTAAFASSVLSRETGFEPFKNVFNPVQEPLRIRYWVPIEYEDIDLMVIDLQGNKIKVLAPGQLIEDAYETFWDGRNKSGDVVASGVYILKIKAGGKTEFKKIVVVK